MPVSSPPGSVLRWPSAADVLREAGCWAEQQRQGQPQLLVVGIFGSYGRGDAGVGSDLDLLLILQECSEPIWDRLRRLSSAPLRIAILETAKRLLPPARLAGSCWRRLAASAELSARADEPASGQPWPFSPRRGIRRVQEPGQVSAWTTTLQRHKWLRVLILFGRVANKLPQPEGRGYEQGKLLGTRVSGSGLDPPPQWTTEG